MILNRYYLELLTAASQRSVNLNHRYFLQNIKNLSIALCMVGLLCTKLPAAPTEERQLIEEFKTNERGPFGNVRWFCNNGQIIVPRAGNCNSRGDGVQHGEYLSSTKALRSEGFPIATVFADIDQETAEKLVGDFDTIPGILLERYLISRDDGWIFRKARFIRGMFQVEDEVRGASTLLRTLLHRSALLEDHYLLLREAVRLLPGYYDEGTLHFVRAESSRLASSDRRFISIKNKLHNQPEPSDIDTILTYAQRAPSSLRTRYSRLADMLRMAFDTTRNTGAILDLLNKVEQETTPSQLRDTLLLIRSTVRSPRLSISQSEELFDAMYQLRHYFPRFSSADARLTALTLSVKLEDLLVAQLLSRTNPPELLPRRTLLEHLYHLGKALYGIGVLSEREQHALSYSVAHILEDTITVANYDSELQYLQRVMAWSSATIQYEFGPMLEKLSQIEPLVLEFADDRLRASLLARYGRLLNILLKDNASLTRKEHSLFGEKTTSGIRSMNPGLARGILIDPTAPYVPLHDPARSIYLVSETVATLPAVAGILTKNEGNPLSHVQLLARNLGIPNIVISANLLGKLQPKVGKPVVIAASRQGRVVISNDSSEWNKRFEESNRQSSGLLEPDLDKLDLRKREPIPLNSLESDDSGRTVGPKAAKLGELKSMFPAMVTEGIALPFGMFNEVLKTPKNSEQTLLAWMKTAYARIKRASPGRERIALSQQVLAEIRQFILAWRFPPAMRQKIEIALQTSFGRDGAYGVFVRSDTNIEDLPNFTGAGLNLTLPNVIGTDNIIEAIKQVWASPFTERAFSWRQAWMPQPEHVYVSVLLLKSVPVDRSGVMVTGDVDTGDLNYLTIAANEGIGGAVDNQKAESILLDRQKGVVRLLSEASAHEKKVLSSQGGIIKLPVKSRRELITKNDLLELNRLALTIHDDFPGFDRSEGTGIADVEFGFIGSKLMLFQIRPFVESGWVQKLGFLRELDKSSSRNMDKILRSAIRLNDRVYAQL